ncbi:MAG: hypothetical protein ACR2M1_11195 [Gemmatimonadaceae bacterium]
MTKTLKRTLSCAATEELCGRVDKVAELEARSPSQVVVSAADLYTRLPVEAHIALRRIESLGGEAELQRTVVDMGRYILDRQFDAARSAVAATMDVDALSALESDDEFLSAASAVIAKTSTRAP